eukprot:NODE_4714_length_634_cov_5.748718_g4053_i0.p1 GENE.NODE_4714_length_634_cov_5.748718_g4053_i0~~NODE_4714_length_634_cov_5.748718_g4053_i0.p1  ORF type:complete len:92 (+),score=15.01 NODE_4714_length_634_cov_5.748718_g4053_i0:215-490(+)
MPRGTKLVFVQRHLLEFTPAPVTLPSSLANSGDCIGTEWMHVPEGTHMDKMKTINFPRTKLFHTNKAVGNRRYRRFYTMESAAKSAKMWNS